MGVIDDTAFCSTASNGVSLMLHFSAEKHAVAMSGQTAEGAMLEDSLGPATSVTDDVASGNSEVEGAGSVSGPSLLIGAAPAGMGQRGWGTLQ